MLRTLLWFKQDLRLDDHPGVRYIAQSAHTLPVYVFDPRSLDFAEEHRVGVHRARFLLEGLAALDGELRQRGSQLIVRVGDPEKIIPELVARFELQEVVTLNELAGREQQLANLRTALAPVPLTTFTTDGLLDEQGVAVDNQAVLSFGRFVDFVDRLHPVFQPKQAPDSLPPLPAGAAERIEPLPTLSQLGLGEPLAFKHSAFPFSGGEPAARARLHDYLWTTQNVRQYQEGRNGMIGTEFSSKLSPWLAQGSLSPRRVAAELRRYEAQAGSNESTQLFWHELLWREFFRWTLLRHGNALLEGKGLKATAQAPTGNDQRFTDWCIGSTGMPIVDACMREIRATGYLSGRGRRITANFLIQNLQQDWRLGAAWFEEHLLDYEPASNWGNWAFLAAAYGDPRRTTDFNVLRQARQFDPEAEYVALWLPELRAVPANLRHTPFLLANLQFEMLRYPRLQDIPANWQPFLPTAAA